ncbi:hypothetical protein OEZ85_004703 [Tetradesmus obliquus]|uniref:Uncharacterized protein n=1 Tax=Tetradesmus obliquus TaxID=3088 RepID=A0ABY8UQ29_TETOB|nr:hypothetical protein OEZ85_004703 [Tetradesmus obliquus]
MAMHPELVAYHSTCDRPPLSAELGPPDYYPLVPGGCPEDTVDAATLASGYKWVPDSLRITEANEPLLSLTCHNAAYWDEHNAHALRQCVHSRLAAVHRQRQAKKKARLRFEVQLGPDAARSSFSAALPQPRAASEQELSGWLLDLAGNCPLADLAARLPDSIERDGLLLSFSVPVAVSQLSACCLAGDAHAAMAALTPAIKGCIYDDVTG